MNKYLLTAIISTSALFTLYLVYVYGIVAFNLANAFATYVIFFGITGCFGACIATSVYGIKGIKEKSTRGQSIATVIVSGFGATFGALLFLYFLLFIVLSFMHV